MAPLEPHEKLFVDTDFLEEDKHGQMLTCEKCHGGDPADNNWKTAHKGVVRDPSYSDPQKTCGACHSSIVKKNDVSLHLNLSSYKNKMAFRMSSDKGVQQKITKAMDTHCMGCHSSCGQCHVSRPKSVGSGLIDGHLFQKTPPVETNCTSCHGSRMEKEYFGKNEGIPADVHHVKGRMTCTDCHTGDEMHGSGKASFDRYAQTNRARCESCHQESGIEKAGNNKQGKVLKHPSHDIHRDKVSCQVCHSASYKNCYNCHIGKKRGTAYFKTDPSVMGFKIGKNPNPTEDRPETYVTVRHVPIHKGLFDFYVKDALPNFDKLPTWKLATPHNIQLKTPQNKDCLSCHNNSSVFLSEKDVKPEELKANQSVIADVNTDLHEIHKWLPDTDMHLSKVDCLKCHQANPQDVERYVKEGKVSHLSCAMCHKDIAEEYEKSCHFLKENFACQVCHSEKEIHAEKSDKKNFKIRVLEKCTECHAGVEYVHSGHGKAVLAGNQDAATCSDCHGLHNPTVFKACGEERNLDKAQVFYNETCKKCHNDEEMMKRNGLSPNTVSYYENTYHGKEVHNVCCPDRVAGCVDCHTSHNILPKEDLFSTINPNNLIVNCGKCHEGFHPQFVQYKPHPDYHDHERYPILYWTFMAMSGLLFSVFLFFGAHTILWWRKVYWEEHKLEKMGIVLKTPLSDEEKIQEVERFSPVKRLLHVVLVICFLILVLTGFPLMFHHTGWAEFMIRMVGGTYNAGLLHRGAAVVLILMFVYVVWISLRFLFPAGKGTEGFFDRLFGPDSLMFNLKDWEDMKGMFKWFFNKGEMPKFDRWTYWEKFDFLAVFWGMAVIGGSGVILMNTEKASYLFPGWVFNVAALLHSDEGLLAALFIFVVHYFNTHLIPNRFPMDRIVFSGRCKLEEMYKQRPLEYERLVREGRLDTIKAEHPSIFTKLVSSIFGYFGLTLGVICAILILISLFRHF